MFEQAREAMESGLNGKDSGTQTEGSNESTRESSQSNNDSNTSESRSSQPQIVELDKLEKFKYNGRELTPKEIESWEKGHMMQADYTKKTQAIAEERKYYDNLPADLKKVASDSRLAEEFRKIYPERFHGYVDFLIEQSKRNNPNVQAPESQERQALDPAVMEKLKKLDEIDELKSFVNEAKQKAYETELKQVETNLAMLSDRFTKAYPFAQEHSVLSLASAIVAEGKELDEKTFENIWKADHERTEKYFKTYQKQLNEKQLEANTRGKDVASGGGIPGQAPKVMSLREARDAAILGLSGKNNG
jgi:hypothetical protein